jgi:hypothetical protein
MPTQVLATEAEILGAFATPELMLRAFVRSGIETYRNHMALYSLDLVYTNGRNGLTAESLLAESAEDSEQGFILDWEVVAQLPKVDRLHLNVPIEMTDYEVYKHVREPLEGKPVDFVLRKNIYEPGSFIFNRPTDTRPERP